MNYSSLQKAFVALAAEPEVARVASLLVKNYRGGFRALSLLAESDEPMTPSQLATLSEVSTARMTVILNSLQLKGYLRKHRKRSDRRSLVVSLTEKGKEALEENKASLLRSIKGLASRLNEEELKAALKICQKLAPAGQKGE